MLFLLQLIGAVLLAVFIPAPLPSVQCALPHFDPAACLWTNNHFTIIFVLTPLVVATLFRKKPPSARVAQAVQILTLISAATILWAAYMGVRGQLQKHAVEDPERQVVSAKQRFQNLTQYQQNFIQSFNELMWLRVPDPIAVRQTKLRTFMEDYLVEKPRLDSRLLFLSSLVAQEKLNFQKALAASVSLQSQVLLSRLEEEFGFAGFITKIVSLASVVMGGTGFTLFILKQSAPPILAMAFLSIYSVATLKLSEFFSITHLMHKAKQYQNQLQFLNSGQKLTCLQSSLQANKIYKSSQQTGDLTGLLQKVAVFERQDDRVIDFKKFQHRECNYRIVFSQNQCKGEQDQNCRQILKLPAACQLTDIKKVSAGLVELYTLSTRLHSLTGEVDQFLNRLDGNSLWECNRALNKAKEGLLQGLKWWGQALFRTSLGLWLGCLFSGGLVVRHYRQKQE